MENRVEDVKGQNEEAAAWNKAQEALARRGFRTVRLLGEGAFSRVLLVRELCSGSFLACKICGHSDMALREARLLERVDHPLFPKFFGAWQEDKTVFLVMEYVCGSSLEAHLKRRGSFCSEQTVRTGIELAEGIRYLHELPEPLLFRDIKPANILIRQDGRVKLLDLGCACGFGEQTALAGTPEYAAPEQMAGKGALTPACDVYGLGKTLRAMAGEDGRRELVRVLGDCTALRQEERIPDMRGVIAELSVLRQEGRTGKRLPSPFGMRRSRAVCVKSVWESYYKQG